jgi:hypothetical protein
MITNKDLQVYELETIEGYFDLIITSKLNGQYTQVKEQINALSKEQKKDFIKWCVDYIGTPQENWGGLAADLTDHFYCYKIALELI